MDTQIPIITRNTFSLVGQDAPANLTEEDLSMDISNLNLYNILYLRPNAGALKKLHLTWQPAADLWSQKPTEIYSPFTPENNWSRFLSALNWIGPNHLHFCDRGIPLLFGRHTGNWQQQRYHQQEQTTAFSSDMQLWTFHPQKLAVTTNLAINKMHLSASGYFVGKTQTHDDHKPTRVKKNKTKEKTPNTHAIIVYP